MKDDAPCKYCGSKHRESKGIRGLYRRYKCLDCGKQYSCFLDSGDIVDPTGEFYQRHHPS